MSVLLIERSESIVVHLSPLESASAKRGVYDFLRALDLAPYERQHALDQAKGSNPYVGYVIDEVMGWGVAVVVGFSLDDLVQ